MKTRKHAGQVKHLAPDLQKRLIAYTTAATFGAFFGGQSVKAQVVESAALAPYPATLQADTGTNTVDLPFDVDGDGTNDFELYIFGAGRLPVNSQVVQGVGYVNSPGVTNLFLNNATSTSYLHAWLGGTTINASTGIPPTYQPRLAIAYYFLDYVALNNFFPATGSLGFSFVSGLDGQTHFGYIDVRVNSGTNSLGDKIITSLTVNDIYYNATPNEGITVPVEVVVTNIIAGANNAITIDFSSNDNAAASAFTLETSPTLGPSANWATDPEAVITLLHAGAANKPLAYYQAVTTGTGAPSQFYRISH
ncbi:MAG: hypothetical protein ACREC8_08760 [Limisphaerales bacterium]